MPIPGLSLVAFMDEQDALNYFRRECVVADTADGALRGWWQDARARLCLPSANVGRPEIIEIESKHSGYLAGVPSNPRYAETIAGMKASFRLVEIAPLLSFQFHVHTDPSRLPFEAAAANPPMRQILRWCLPHAVRLPKIRVEVVGNEQWIICDDLNYALRPNARISTDLNTSETCVELRYGTRSPFVQVVQFAGRCYLKNGYHRAHQLGVLGITHIPCVFLEATTWEQVVGPGDPMVFPRQLLESFNPPTCGHFVRGEAYEIILPVRRLAHRMMATVQREEEW